MTERYRKHAEALVEAFKGFLPASLANEISEAHFDELSMMVESAIDTAVLEHQEAFAARLIKLAEEVRGNAERFDRT
jgi:hypothetical protein